MIVVENAQGRDSRATEAEEDCEDRPFDGNDAVFGCCGAQEGEQRWENTKDDC